MSVILAVVLMWFADGAVGVYAIPVHNADECVAVLQSIYDNIPTEHGEVTLSYATCSPQLTGSPPPFELDIPRLTGRGA